MIIASEGVNNAGMIRRTINLLHCRDQDKVLEIGPGNGGYAAYVLSTAVHIRYYGIDISAIMIQQGMSMMGTMIEKERIVIVTEKS
jgi:protein-L-isoaspartate O-methyltransferase